MSALQKNRATRERLYPLSVINLEGIVWRGSTTRLDISDIDLRGRYAAIMDLPYIDLRGRYRASRGVYWRRRASEMKMYSFAFPSRGVRNRCTGLHRARSRCACPWYNFGFSLLGRARALEVKYVLLRAKPMLSKFLPTKPKLVSVDNSPPRRLRGG